MATERLEQRVTSRLWRPRNVIGASQEPLHGSVEEHVRFCELRSGPSSAASDCRKLTDYLVDAPGAHHGPEDRPVAVRWPDLELFVRRLHQPFIDSYAFEVEVVLRLLAGVSIRDILERFEDDLECGQPLLSVDDVPGTDPITEHGTLARDDRTEEVRNIRLTLEHCLGLVVDVLPERLPLSFERPHVRPLIQRHRKSALVVEQVVDRGFVRFHVQPLSRSVDTFTAPEPILSANLRTLSQAEVTKPQRRLLTGTLGARSRLRSDHFDELRDHLQLARASACEHDSLKSARSWHRSLLPHNSLEVVLLDVRV